MTHPFPLAHILGAPVEAAGSRVGVVSGVYADPAAAYVVGVEAIGPNGRFWFLPWVAGSFGDGLVVAASPLVFVPAEQLDFYVRLGAKLPETDMDGVAVDGDGRVTRVSQTGSVSPVRGGGTAIP